MREPLVRDNGPARRPLKDDLEGVGGAAIRLDQRIDRRKPQAGLQGLLAPDPPGQLQRAAASQIPGTLKLHLLVRLVGVSHAHEAALHRRPVQASP